jgi:hypothetical protein
VQQSHGSSRMSRHFTGFRLWALMSCIISLVIALIVPAQFDSMGWLWVLVPPAIVLSGVAAVCFAFSYTAPQLTSVSLRVSRYSRLTAISLTVGFGYLDGWFYYCAVENGCSSRLAVVPGVVILAFAWFMLYRFYYEIPAAQHL